MVDRQTPKERFTTNMLWLKDSGLSGNLNRTHRQPDITFFDLVSELCSCFEWIFDHKRRNLDARTFDMRSLLLYYYYFFEALFYPWRLFRFSPSPALSLLHVGALSGFHRVDSFVSCHSLRFYSWRPRGFSPCPSVYAFYFNF